MSFIKLHRIGVHKLEGSNSRVQGVHGAGPVTTVQPMPSTRLLETANYELTEVNKMSQHNNAQEMTDYS